LALSFGFGSANPGDSDLFGRTIGILCGLSRLQLRTVTTPAMRASFALICSDS